MVMRLSQLAVNFLLGIFVLISSSLLSIPILFHLLDENLFKHHPFSRG